MPISRLADRDRISRLLHGASTTPAWTDLRTNNYGFLSTHDYPYEASPDEYVVGIFGGSVAQWFALQGSDRIRERLLRLPSIEGRNLVVLNFAQGGFKQPQQLQTLTYFLALGQHFDFVLNLDGFNEIALSHINHSNRIATSMPSAEHLVPLLHLLGSADHDLVGSESVRRLREAENELRRRERWSASNRSAGLHLILDVLHSRALDRHSEALEALQSLPPVTERSAPVGLTELPADYDLSNSLDDALILWLDASLTMQSVCAANDLPYLEVVQPNQYFSSKRFSAQERRIAMSGRSPYRLAVQRGYAALPAHLRRVQGLGLQIHSAVAIFDDVEEIVYSDDCCHYNQIGNEILADFVAEQIAALLASRSEAIGGKVLPAYR
jgi:hypothetical protein